MLDKPDSIFTLGLELEDNILKGIQLSFLKGKPTLESFFEVDVSQNNDNVKPLYIRPNQSLQEISKKFVSVTSLDTSETFIRQIDIKLKKEKDILETLAFQAEPLLPYPVENAVLEKIKVSGNQEGTKLTLIAARNDHLKNHLEQWQGLNIDPEVVSCVPVALGLFGNYLLARQATYFILHVGYDSTSCVLMNEGKLAAAQSLPLGIYSLREAFLKDVTGDEERNSFENFDFAGLDSSKLPQFHLASEALKRGITRVLYSMTKQSKVKEAAEVLITGSTGHLTNLTPFLVEQLKNQVIYPEPISNLSSEQLQEFAIPFGNALNAIHKNPNPINFRQRDFSYPNPWKRLMKPIGIYLGLCFLCALAFSFFGNAYIAYREDQIKTSFVELLALTNKPYQTFEDQYLSKFPDEAKNVPLSELKQEDLLNRINFLEKELQSIPDSFALLPNVPRVSDLLAWLSAHPILLSKQDNQTLHQPIQIENLAYTMVKRPEQTKKQEKYQIKVDIEFSSPTPKQAREFHDALIAPNDFVDPKGEVKWSSNRGKYRTSFFLKDKTNYPSAS